MLLVRLQKLAPLLEYLPGAQAVGAYKMFSCIERLAWLVLPQKSGRWASFHTDARQLAASLALALVASVAGARRCAHAGDAVCRTARAGSSAWPRVLVGLTVFCDGKAREREPHGD